MKKVSLLSMIAAAVLFSGNLFAQFSYNFDQYTAGDKVAQTIGEPWTTWSNAPGGTEDGVFSDEIASSGTISVKIAGSTDQVLLLGDKETGVYNIKFDLMIPTGYNGYFNVLHDFAGSSSVFAMQAYFNLTNDGQNTTVAPGQGTLHAGGAAAATFTCVSDQWMSIRVHVDTDTDMAQFYIDEQLIYEWQWSFDSFNTTSVSRKLDAVDFFPPQTDGTSLFYLDNVVFEQENANQELIGESFEEYTVGNKVGTESAAAGHDWWTTWSNTPGSAEDGEVSNEQASEGSNAMKAVYGNDVVMLLGDKETGVYDIEFDMYVPTGKNAYFNVLHDFSGSTSTQAMQVYFHLTNDGQNTTVAPGQGTLHAGAAAAATFTCVSDAWMAIKVHIDADNDMAQFYIDDQLIYEWQWSFDSFNATTVSRKLAGVDFYPSEDAATSLFYIDNIHFTQIGGESAPNMNVSEDEMVVELEANDMTTETLTINNAGNSIGDWIGWVDFGQGGNGTQTAELSYYTGEYNGNAIGYDVDILAEIAIKLPAASYAGAAMGMKLTAAKFYIGNNTSSDNNYTFRIYGQGANGLIGEVLAEKTLNDSGTLKWITCTFDNDVYMTGQDMWVALELHQSAEDRVFTVDAGPTAGNSDWIRTNGGSWHMVHEDAPEYSYNWLLGAICQGELVNGTWAQLGTADGSLMGGQSQDVNLSVNTIGMNNGETYHANIVFKTNDENHPSIEIPLTLKVGTDAVAETENSLCKVYPNPATSQVVLEGENLSSVAIYNAVGQLVNIVRLENVVNTISLSEMEAGMYFFSIYDNAGNNSVKSVVVTK